MYYECCKLLIKKDFAMFGLPDLPDDDNDFTPDLARKIIAKYQEYIRLHVRESVVQGRPVTAPERTVEAARKIVKENTNLPPDAVNAGMFDDCAEMRCTLAALAKGGHKND
jgi:hypothetical protein